MNRSRILSLSIAALLLGAITASTHAQDVLDGMAAVVNEDVITFSQVRQLVGTKEASARESLKGDALGAKIKEIRAEAISDLIDRQLILQEFKKNKAKVPEHYVDDQVGTIIRENFGGDRSAFLRTLSAQGLSIEKFKQFETEKIIVQAMRRQMVKVDNSVPASRLLSAYEAQKEKYTTPEQIKLRLLSVKKATDGSQSRRQMIEEIRHKILDGVDFEDLAHLYSEDSTQEVGGDWGWVDRKTLNENLAKVAFSLKPGKVSEVVEFASSYYLLLVEARRSAATKPIQEVRGEIERSLMQEERQKREQEWVAKLRKKAYIRTF
jgi:peptidyl-prolyl cis-trans isomerase SurA